MKSQNLINNFNIDLFKVKTHFNLRHNSISADSWEKTVAESISGKWIKGSAHLFDCYSPSEKVGVSVKSIKMEPHIKKRIDNRDFISHPDYFHFGGKKNHMSDLDNIYTVSGRCPISLDGQTTSPEEIGKLAIKKYTEFGNASLKRFDCDEILDVVIVHGMSRDHSQYLLRLMFYKHDLNDIHRWEEVMFDGPRTKYKGNRDKILGYDDNGPHLGWIALGRQQTCTIRFYRKSEAIFTIDTSIPVPKQEKFDFIKESSLML